VEELLLVEIYKPRWSPFLLKAFRIHLKTFFVIKNADLRRKDHPIKNVVRAKTKTCRKRKFASTEQPPVWV
jgi:hypothetical protein